MIIRGQHHLSKVGLAIGMLGITYLIWKVISLQGQDLTFKYIWLAGNLWQDGLNPYSIEYQEIGHKMFTAFNGQPFYYPPNWWPFSNILAAFDYTTATEIWRVLNGLCIISSTFLLNGAMKKIGINLTLSSLILYTGLVSLMQASAIIIATGQTTILIYFGLCLVIYSAVNSRPLLLALGLCVMLLKPQIGVALFFAFIPFKKYHMALLYTCVLTFLLMLPALITIGPLETILPFLKGLSQHSSFATNEAQNSTGLKSILYSITNFKLPSTMATLLSIVGTLGAGLYFKKSDKENSTNFITYWMIIIMITAFVAPLHEYDMIIIAPLILLCAIYGVRAQWLLSIPFIILARSGNIGDLLTPENADDARYYTSVITTIALVAMVIILCKVIRQAKEE